MKFVKIEYAKETDYIPVNSGRWGDFSASENEDGTVSLKYYCTVYRYARPSHTCSNYTRDLCQITYALKECEITRIYTYATESDYLHGAVNRPYYLDVSLASSKEAIENMKKSATCVAYLLLLGKYDEAKKYYDSLTEEEKADGSAAAFAVLYEHGVVIEKNLEGAFVDYLNERSTNDILRFIKMGFGKDVPMCEDFSLEGTEEKIAYWTYMLSDTTPYYGIIDLLRYASDWYLLSEVCLNDNDSSTDYTNIETRLKDSEFWGQKQKYFALLQLEAAKLLIAKSKNENVKNDLVLYLGAYFAYLEKGNHDNIFRIEMVNIGDEYESDWVKERIYDTERALGYIRDYALRGNELARLALMICEDKNE